MRNLKKSTDKLLELIRGFSKFAGHRINRQISFMSYISNNNLENKNFLIFYLQKHKKQLPNYRTKVHDDCM